MKKEVVDLNIIKTPPIKLSKLEMLIWEQAWRTKPAELTWTANDHFPLVAYCKSYALYFECQEYIKKNGLKEQTSNGNNIQIVEVGAGNKALANALSLSKVLGLSPLDKNRLRLKAKEKRMLDDPFSEVV